jgi:hypothetical protein
MTIMAKGGIAYESRGEGLPFIALHGYSLDRRMSIGAFEPLFEDGGGTIRPRRPGVPAHLSGPALHGRID